MKIQWLGHSSFRILGSKTIVTDPYGEIGLRFPDVRADIVTVSHGHHDHANGLPAFLPSGVAPVVLPNRTL